MRRNQQRRITIQCMLDQTRHNDPDYVRQDSSQTSSPNNALYSTYSVIDHEVSNINTFTKQRAMGSVNEQDFETFEIKIKHKCVLAINNIKHDTFKFDENQDKQINKRSNKQHDQTNQQKQNEIHKLSTIKHQNLILSQLKSANNKPKLILQNKQNQIQHNSWLAPLNQEQKEERRKRLQNLKKDFQRFNKINGLTGGKQLYQNECCLIM